MLILQTSHTYPPKVDGVSEVVAQISNRLVARGHEVHVVTSALPGLPQEELIDGVHVHRFAVTGDSLRGIRGEVDTFMQFVASREWDIVAMHHSGIWTTDLLLPELRRLSCGKVFIPHGLIRFNYPQFAGYFEEMAGHLAYCDAIVALSPLTEESKFAAAHGLQKPVIIRNGVDTNKFSGPKRQVRARWNIGDRPWMVVVGNHNPNKGHAAVFDVMNAVRRHNKDAKATIIGGNYPAAKWSLGRLGIKGGCWHRCRLSSISHTGVELRRNVPREDVLSAIREADLLLVTSKWEASPLMVLESMAAGTPWLSFDVGCVSEHVGGLVVRSAPEMADTAIELLGNAARRRELGAAGRERVAERHDWDNIVRQYEELFSAAAKGSLTPHFAQRT